MSDLAWSQSILQTVHSEFADITDLSQLTRILLRLGLAGLLGGLLGWERESAGKDAGIRTHMLVAMGSALFVMLILQEGAQVSQTSQVIQGVITGIGFLGAGAILKEHGSSDCGGQVRGLTTAAGIWLTAAIGVACGLGEESTAIFSAMLAWVILSLVPILHRPTKSASTSNADASSHPSHSQTQSQQSD